MTAVLSEPVINPDYGLKDVDHTVCHCDENLALCGVDVTSEQWCDYDCANHPQCWRCDNIKYCPQCGRKQG